MVKLNENYLKLPGSYLFSTIGRKVAAYSAESPKESRNIMAAERMVAMGLATSFPAMSGAEPWMGS